MERIKSAAVDIFGACKSSDCSQVTYATSHVVSGRFGKSCSVLQIPYREGHSHKPASLTAEEYRLTIPQLGARPTCLACPSCMPPIFPSGDVGGCQNSGQFRKRPAPIPTFPVARRLPPGRTDNGTVWRRSISSSASRASGRRRNRMFRHCRLVLRSGAFVHVCTPPRQKSRTRPCGKWRVYA